MRSLMMMMALAGCGPSSALEIVVEMPPQNPGIDHVQLYLGLGSSVNASVERLVPRGYPSPDVPDGFYWKRDPNGGSDVIAVEPGASNVRFVFQEGTNDQVTAIVVGFRGDQIVAAASLVDAYLESGSVRQYHVALKPASAAFPRPSMASTTVQRWGPTAGDTHCVYLEDPSNQSDPSIFIVDKEDRDCDGFADEDPLECRPDVYLGKERPKRIETTCVTADVLAGNESMCVLGGAGCVDGVGETDDRCDPAATCVQPAVCTACAGRADGLACMADLPAQNAATTRIECAFFVDQATNKVCPGPAVLAQRLQFLPACAVDANYLMWSQNKWKATAITEMGLTFTANKPTAPCDFKLEVSGTATVAQLLPVSSLLSVAFTNGRSAAIPLRLDFEMAPDCVTVQNTCLVEGDNTAAPPLLACLGARVDEL